MKGGSQEESPFYHSFGKFIQHDFSKFDTEINDYPMNMDVDNIMDYSEKLPHLRLVFKDQEAKNIAIKILCLHIRYSGVHHNNDRPRLTENLRQIIEQFMQV